MSSTLITPADIPASSNCSTRIGLATATLLWSGNFVVGRALRHDFAPLELNFLRWTVALLALLPFTTAALINQWSILRRHWGLIVGLAISGVAVPHACIYAALQTTSPVNALLLMSLTPLLIVLGARIAFGQPVRAHQWLGMAIAMAGGVALIARGSLEGLVNLEFRRGDLWMLPAITAAAIQALLLRRTPEGVGQGPMLLVSAATGLVIMFPVLMLNGGLSLPANSRDLAGLGYVGVFASAAAFALWNRGIERVGAARAATYLFLMPLYGTVLAFLVLGEAVAGFQYAGGALVLMGLWISRARSRALR